MTDWTRYTSIDGIEKTIGHLVGTDVHIVEKIDGSNFSIHVTKTGKKSHDVTFHSRGQRLNPESPGQFAQAIELAQHIVPDILRYGEATYYFEYFGEGIQKRIPYSNAKHLVLIDIKVNGKYMNYDKMVNRAGKLGVYVAPSYGTVKLTTALIEEMTEGAGDFETSKVVLDFAGVQVDHIGDLGERTRPEGFVLKPTKEWRNQYDSRVIAKVKQSWFTSKENKGEGKKKTTKLVPTEIIEFAINSVDFDRLASVYSHGEFEPQYAMQDMKHLIRLVAADIRSEGDEIWSRHEDGVIVGEINRRLPVVLKDYLMEVNSK